jgi:hypothetical protein
VITSSNMWPFSVENLKGHFSLTFFGWVAIGIEWETAYPIIQWFIISGIFVGFLIIPRFVFLYLERKGVYDKWACSVCHSNANSRFFDYRLSLWALLEGARNPYLWWGQIFYIAFLVVFPWFWGNVLADEYPVGYMTLRGWTVWHSKDTVAQQSNVGWPDIMAVVLPYMLVVVLPMVLMVSALCTEQAACELVDPAIRQATGSSAKKDTARKTDVESAIISKAVFRRIFSKGAGGEERTPLLEDVEDASPSAEAVPHVTTEDGEKQVVVQERSPWSPFHRKIRKVFFIICVLVAALHLWLCLSLTEAYGAQIFLSPVYVCSAPAIMAASLFVTSPIKHRSF